MQCRSTDLFDSELKLKCVAIRYDVIISELMVTVQGHNVTSPVISYISGAG